MKRPWMWILSAIALYVSACFLPAIVDGDARPVPGWVALLWGWIPPMIFPWSANPLLALGLIFYVFGSYLAARRLGLLASLIAPMTWTMYGPGDLHVGYALWQSSFVAFTAGAWLASRRTLPAGIPSARPPDADNPSCEADDRPAEPQG